MRSAVSLKAPFPYFGGKSAIADVVWQHFGNVPHYIEPFAGSLAVLLARPHRGKVETVNDLNSYIANFWRAVKMAPDEVAYYADWPVNEADLHARHRWLIGQRESLTEKLMDNPDYYDAKIAGWWVWGISAWLGSGWCSDKSILASESNTIKTTKRRPHLTHKGQGLIAIAARETVLNQKQCSIQQLGTPSTPKTVQSIPQTGHMGRGVIALARTDTTVDWVGQCERSYEAIRAYMQLLADRLRLVRVLCGDWSRVVSPCILSTYSPTAIFLDPPYSVERDETLYGDQDNVQVSHQVREWCIKNGSNPKLRIALCGYRGEHDILAQYGWTPYYWKANGGYGNQGEDRGRYNAYREVVWFSPHCLTQKTLNLFEE